MHCSRHCPCNFDRNNCRCTVHDTVEAIWTVKIVDVMMTIGSICSHDTINRSPNVFFYTHKILHNRSFKSLSVSKPNHSQSPDQITPNHQTKSFSVSKPNHYQSSDQITFSHQTKSLSVSKPNHSQSPNLITLSHQGKHKQKHPCPSLL